MGTLYETRRALIGDVGSGGGSGFGGRQTQHRSNHGGSAGFFCGEGLEGGLTSPSDSSELFRLRFESVFLSVLRCRSRRRDSIACGERRL